MTDKIDYLVTGGYGGNLGDDCLMVTLYSILKRHKRNRKIGFLVGDKDRVNNLMPSNISCWDYYQNFHIESKNLIYGGGTIFYDFGIKTHNRAENIKRYIRTPKELYKAIKKRVCSHTIRYNKVYYLGIGIGPFINKSPKLLHTQQLLSKAKLIVFRDEESLQYYNGSNVIIGEDICYSSYFYDYLNIDTKSKLSFTNKIGIIVRDWNAGNQNLYINKLLDMVDSAEYSKYEFVFYIFSEITDHKIIRLLKKRGQTVYIWNNKEESITSFFKKMQSCSIIISSRFHGVIFSAMLNIPFIGINIDPKLELITEKYVNENMECLFLVENDYNIIKNINCHCTFIQNNYEECINNIKLVNSVISERSNNIINHFIENFNHE